MLFWTVIFLTFYIVALINGNAFNFVVDYLYTEILKMQPFDEIPEEGGASKTLIARRTNEKVIKNIAIAALVLVVICLIGGIAKFVILLKAFKLVGVSKLFTLVMLVMLIGGMFMPSKTKKATSVNAKTEITRADIENINRTYHELKAKRYNIKSILFNLINVAYFGLLFYIQVFGG